EAVRRRGARHHQVRRGKGMTAADILARIPRRQLQTRDGIIWAAEQYGEGLRQMRLSSPAMETAIREGEHNVELRRRLYGGRGGRLRLPLQGALPALAAEHTAGSRLSVSNANCTRGCDRLHRAYRLGGCRDPVPSTDEDQRRSRQPPGRAPAQESPSSR